MWRRARSRRAAGTASTSRRERARRQGSNRKQPCLHVTDTTRVTEGVRYRHRPDALRRRRACYRRAKYRVSHSGALACGLKVAQTETGFVRQKLPVRHASRALWQTARTFVRRQPCARSTTSSGLEGLFITHEYRSFNQIDTWESTRYW